MQAVAGFGGFRPGHEVAFEGLKRQIACDLTADMAPHAVSDHHQDVTLRVLLALQDYAEGVFLVVALPNARVARNMHHQAEPLSSTSAQSKLSEQNATKRRWVDLVTSTSAPFSSGKVLATIWPFTLVIFLPEP